MQEILNKLYPYKKNKAVNDILKSYEKNGFVVSNFLYFAIIKVQKLFESTKKTTTQKEYKKAIIKWDFLFPDGIALQTFYNLAAWKFDLPTRNLPNLNGTDFVSYFLDELKKRYWSQKLCLFLYWAKPAIVKETKQYFEYKGLNVVFAQDGYSELDRDKLNQSKQEYQDTINIMLVAISTPEKPIQELRTIKNQTKIKDNKFILFTVWWLFDFMAADLDSYKAKNKDKAHLSERINKDEKWSLQKRAPKFVRKMKLEWLWRLITDPKRNFKKVKSSLALFPYILKYLLLKKD